jgi:GntR family transcriptional regulator/MocR family aminotransferase
MSTFLPEWAADLYLELPQGDHPHPVQDRVRSALKSAIRSGRLAGGSKLPPSRELAAELSCSRSAVVNAYAQLVAEGYLETRQGSGTRVARARSVPSVNEAWINGEQLPRISFSAGVCDLSSFPRADWQHAVGYVMATVPLSELYYTEPVGTRRFRAVLAERLARVRGVVTDPRRVHVCAGTVQAVSLLARTFAARGITAVAVENPSWPRLRPPLLAEGLRIIPVRVDENGLVVSDLARHSDAAAVFVTPAHQFPTGVTMSPSRRAELLDWAARTDGLVVEDDYDAEFNLGTAQIGALQMLDPSRVIYLGTTSKILSPALRLGWVVAPPAVSAELDRARPGVDLGISVIEQQAMAHLMSTGKLDRHLRQTRQMYNRRRNLLVSALRACIPDAQIMGARAGLHLIARLPPDVDESRVVAEAAKRSVGVFGLGYYRIGRPRSAPGALVLGYASLNDTSITTGVQLIAESIEAVRGRPA